MKVKLKDVDDVPYMDCRGTVRNKQGAAGIIDVRWSEYIGTKFDMSEANFLIAGILKNSENILNDIAKAEYPKWIQDKKFLNISIDTVILTTGSFKKDDMVAFIWFAGKEMSTKKLYVDVIAASWDGKKSFNHTVKFN